MRDRQIPSSVLRCRWPGVTNFTDSELVDRSNPLFDGSRGIPLNPCLVLIVTRGFRVWLPPEVYLQRRLAEMESDRWRAALRLPVAQPRFSTRARCLHLISSEFPDSWRACPVWVGVTWSAKTYPRLRSELMAADEKEAATWFRRRTPKGVGRGVEKQAEFERRGVLTSVGVFRVKRVMGF